MGARRPEIKKPGPEAPVFLWIEKMARSFNGKILDCLSSDRGSIPLRVANFCDVDVTVSISGIDLRSIRLAAQDGGSSPL